MSADDVPGASSMHRSSITTRDDGVVTTVRLVGEIDVTVRDQSRRAVADVVARGLPVVLDMSGVRFIDSSGVAFLLQCHRTCTSAGLDCRLRDVPRQAEVVLRVLGLDTVLPIEREGAPAGH